MEENHPFQFGLKPFITYLIQNFGVTIYVNLLVLLTSLTVIGIPASLTAGSAVYLRIFRGDPCPVRETYFTVFKREFKRSLGIGLGIQLAILLSLYVAAVYYRMGGENVFLLIAAVVCISLSLIWLAASFYIWIMLALVDLPVRDIFRNSLQLAFLRAPQNIIGVFVILLVGYLYVRNLPLSLSAAPFFSVGLTLFTTTYLAYSGVKKFVLREEKSKTDDDRESFYLQR